MRDSVLAALLALAGGCFDGRREPNSPPASANSEGFLINLESRTHHLGTVISAANRKLVHRYRLANATKHDIRIVDIINRKPCCGELRVGETTLHPGDETELEVKLSIRQEFGDVVHEALVLTQPPQSEELVLRTTAKAYPSIRIEEIAPDNGSILLSTDKPRRAEFRVLATGTSSEPPADLDLVKIRSTIEVDWAGPKGDSPSEDGLRVESRRFTAVLDPAGPPGRHTTEILLQDGEQVHYKHVVSWESASPITAFPKVIVIKPGQRGYRVVVASCDQKLFRITRIESKSQGIQGRAENTAAALTQTVEVERRSDSQSDTGRGEVTVFTDHPAQGKVDLPFVVID